MEAKLLFLHTLSPLHAGTGQSVDVIDLPIAREKATGIPYLPGSTIKGVFRDACDDKNVRKRIFGPGTDEDPSEHSGSVTFTDARLLLLPVRSLKGVFAWVSSPLLLRRLVRDAHDASPLSIKIPTPGEGACHVSNEACALTISAGNSEKVILEDLPLDFTPDADVASLAKTLGEKLFAGDIDAQMDLKSRLVVVADDTLSFLLETATEINARIHIDDQKKTVAKGQLWYEEALPTETVLVSLVIATMVKTDPVNAAKLMSDPEEVFKTVSDISQNTLQFGGKATIGRGLCKTVFLYARKP